MGETNCDQEQAVIRAVVSDEWTRPLQTHVESCVTCRDAVRFSRSLQNLAAAPKPDLPPAGYVWWNSRMRQSRAAQRRVTRLITVTQTVAVAVSITGLAVWMIWHWSEVVDGITSELNSISSWSSSGIASSAVVLIYLSLALLCVNVLLTVRAIVTNNKKE